MKNFVPSFIAAVLVLAASLCPAWRVQTTGFRDVLFRPLWHRFDGAKLCPPPIYPDIPRTVNAAIAWDVMAVIYLCIVLVWGFGMVALRLMAKASVLLWFCVAAEARVGERYEDFLKRPGIVRGATETRGTFTVANHTKDALHIRCFVVEGTISLEVYNPIDATQAASLMQFAGGQWRQIKSAEPTILRWQSDKGLTAYYNGQTFLIGDGRAEKLLATLIREQQKATAPEGRKKLEGL